MLAPATFGLGLALAGCQSSGTSGSEDASGQVGQIDALYMAAFPQPDAAHDVRAPTGGPPGNDAQPAAADVGTGLDSGTVKGAPLYMAMMPDAAPEALQAVPAYMAPVPAYMAPVPDSGVVGPCGTDVCTPDAASLPDAGVVALYSARLPSDAAVDQRYMPDTGAVAMYMARMPVSDAGRDELGMVAMYLALLPPS
jgi:hypothetical protein